MRDDYIEGRVKVGLTRSDGRRVHVIISGLPNWVTELVADAFILKRAGTTYSCDSGASSVSFLGEAIIHVVQPAIEPVDPGPNVDAEVQGPSTEPER